LGVSAYKGSSCCFRGLVLDGGSKWKIRKNLSKLFFCGKISIYWKNCKNLGTLAGKFTMLMLFMHKWKNMVFIYCSYTGTLVLERVNALQ
jgi:hypothetical protein